MTWVICSTLLPPITSNMLTSFNELERCSKLRSFTWGKEWLLWGLSAVRIALVGAHTRVVMPSACCPRTFYHRNKTITTQPSRIMQSRLAPHNRKCSDRRALIVSQVATEVVVVHTQVVYTATINNNKENNILNLTKVNKWPYNLGSQIITYNRKMYAPNPVHNRIGRQAMEQVASRQRIKGHLMNCTDQVQASNKWAERDHMNLSIAMTATTHGSARYQPRSSKSSSEEPPAMTYTKVIATASSTELIPRAIMKTWHIKYNINSTSTMRMLEKRPMPIIKRAVVVSVHSKSRCHLSKILTVVLSNITRTLKYQKTSSISATKKALKCHMRWPSASTKKSLIWSRKQPVWRSNWGKL